MLQQFLLPETEIRQPGEGPVLSVAGNSSDTLTVTLGITRIIEQESIDVSIWGSSDGSDWGTKPLTCFSQKFYCGVYQILLDLSDRRDVKFLRAKWQVNRWGKHSAKPLFAAYIFVQEARTQALVARA
jgi:hypothetical protein